MLYALTIGLGAFLLFQIQPIAARTILPWFGGSAAVWTTCLLFFQGALLLGYAYAHWSDSRRSSRTQSYTYIGLLVLSVALLPIVANVDWTPQAVTDPSFQILLLLASTIGLPYTILATTGPLLQSWYRRSVDGQSLYRLYALSNAGSLLALVSYPIVIEPFLTRRRQAMVWAAAYVVYAVMAATIALTRRASDASQEEASLNTPPAPGPGAYALWICYAACASTLLASITSHLSQNIAPVPFLWILPLSLYLISFIICFSHDRAYWRSVWLPLTVVAVGGMAFAVSGYSQTPRLFFTTGVFVTSLFVCCMFCHGELSRSKPAPVYLTSFYVAIAIGGALGSVFTALIAPRVFVVNGELPVGIVATATLVFVVLYREYLRHLRGRRVRLFLLPPAAGLLVFVTVYVGRGIQNVTRDARVAARNFYGTLRVVDNTDDSPERYRQLFHGTINHGAQILNPDRRCEPVTYYGPGSGVAQAINAERVERSGGPMRVGILGLGTGTIAGFGKPGDVFRFYEINPLVVQLARSEFTFLLECGATIEVANGDARLSLEREPPQQFDVLAVDVFSGDSIPVHLLTQEAVQLFFRHLKPSGILAIHISNRFVRLEPIVSKIAETLNKDMLVMASTSDWNLLLYPTSWVLLAERGGVLQTPALKDATEAREATKGFGLLWTDDFSSLWPVLKWRPE